MITEKAIRALKARLFAHEPKTVFVILDGASVPGLLSTLITFKARYICLYRGQLQPDMAEVAPYLAILEHEGPLIDWIMTGWGMYWGLFGTADADLLTLRKHFRRFVMVCREDGKPMYFRFYDPRVLRDFLPICDSAELKTLFGPVTTYLVEDEEPRSARVFTLVQNQLRDEKTVVEDLPLTALGVMPIRNSLPTPYLQLVISNQKLELLDRLTFYFQVHQFVRARCLKQSFLLWMADSKARNGLWDNLWRDVRHMSEHDCAMVLVYMAVCKYEGTEIAVQAEVLRNPEDHEFHIKEFLADGGYFRFSDFDFS